MATVVVVLMSVAVGLYLFAVDRDCRSTGCAGGCFAPSVAHDGSRSEKLVSSIRIRASKKVAESLQERVRPTACKARIGEVLIPTEDVVEMRAGPQGP